MDTLSEIAVGLGVHPRTVRRVARQLGIAGTLVRGKRGMIRAYGEEEAVRLREYFRRSIPTATEVPEPGEVEPSSTAPTPGSVPPSAPSWGLSLPEVLRPFMEEYQRTQAASVAEATHLREEVHQLREVLSAVAARLPGPPAPPSPPPRLRWRVVAEVVLLGWVGLLAGVLGAVVLQRLADVGVVTLPAWWPLG